MSNSVIKDGGQIPENEEWIPAAMWMLLFFCASVKSYKAFIPSMCLSKLQHVNTGIACT